MHSLVYRGAYLYELTNISWVHTTNLLSSEQENKTHLYTHFTDRLTRSGLIHPPASSFSLDRKVAQKEQRSRTVQAVAKEFSGDAQHSLFLTAKHVTFGFSANRSFTHCVLATRRLLCFCSLLMRERRSLCRMASCSLFALHEYINFHKPGLLFVFAFDVITH